MSNKYKTIGVLGNTVRLRTDSTWIITFPDGEEAKFKNKRLAIMGAKAALSLGDIKLEEETLMRFIKDGKVEDKKFRKYRFNISKLLKFKLVKFVHELNI